MLSKCPAQVSTAGQAKDGFSRWPWERNISGRGARSALPCGVFLHLEDRYRCDQLASCCSKCTTKRSFGDLVTLGASLICHSWKV